MKNQEQFNRFIACHPHAHHSFFRRPHWDRRAFFKLAGAGLTGSFLTLGTKQLDAAEVVAQAQVITRNTAKHVIFILMEGGPSHVDTFDLKMIPGVTPNNLNPERIGGTLWPTALMPKLAGHLGEIAIIRSMRSWALVHEIGRAWMQVGRNPNAREAAIAPHIGSIVGLEKEPERLAHQVFPAFIALNAESANGPGYFSGRYAPFKVTTTTAGLTNITHADGEARFAERYSQLQLLDEPLRGTAITASPLGHDAEDMREFYAAANKLVHNEAINQAFSFTPEDSARYGSDSFGDACLVAKQILAARQGTRFIQIAFGTWDMHRNLYSSLPAQTTRFDNGLSALIKDLKVAGLYDETLIVAGGEFGRSVGALNGQAGRDHYLQQSFLLLGAGVRGKTLGATDPTGGQTIVPGWARERDVRIEDIEATIYSALGINWTTIRQDDPLGIGFPYVPFSQDDVYGPINELWDRTNTPTPLTGGRRGNSGRSSLP